MLNVCSSVVKYIQMSFGDVLSYNQSLQIRGICVLLVVFHNYITGPLTGVSAFILMGLFFFMSGFGVSYSMDTKKGYLDNFLRKRFSRLLVPLGLMYVAYYWINIYIIDSTDFGIDPLWFVCVLLVQYVLSYAIFSVVKTKRGQATLSLVVSLALIIFMYYAYWVGGNAAYFAGSPLCYAFGIIFGIYREGISEFIAKHKVLVATVFDSNVFHIFIHISQ